jgi:hypothetical protein
VGNFSEQNWVLSDERHHCDRCDAAGALSPTASQPAIAHRDGSGQSFPLAIATPPDRPQATAWLTVTLKPWGGRLAIRKGKHPIAEPSERRTIAGPYPPLISTLTAPDAPGRRCHGSRCFEQSFEPHTARVTMSAVSFFTWTLAGSLEVAHPARATLAAAATTSKATPRADDERRGCIVTTASRRDRRDELRGSRGAS